MAYGTTNKRLREQYNRNLLHWARRLVDRFDHYVDPGTADLDDEQPFSVSAPLGVWRDFRMAVRDLESLQPTKKGQKP